MSEYEANYSREEAIINAAQSIKDYLTCRICLELFKEPVTIKCGHKFCQACISRVANNENATCPFCNIKIQKRSIPKEGNEQLELCVERFNALTVAIISDSGIDVLQPCNKVKSTKESASIHEKPNTSKIGNISFFSKESSVTSQKSGKSKANFQSKKRLSLKKRTDSVSKASQDKNTLEKYLTSKSSYVPNEAALTQEKVQNWLENFTPTEIDTAASDYNSEVTVEVSKTKNSPLSELKGHVSSSYETCPSIANSKESKVNSTEQTNETNEESKYKEIQMKIQEMEMIAKRKKLNQNLTDKPILKTPSSIPAASHSDAYDWRRVKRVGKEMQVKTFKSLNVSIEKNSSSIVLDDTVPCNSINNDSKNISRGFDTNSSSNNEVSVSKAKQKITKINTQTEESPEKTIEECSYNQISIDSSNEQKKNISLSHIDQKEMNKIIGIIPDNLKTPEKTKNVQNTIHQESNTTSRNLSPLKTKITVNNEGNNLLDNESSNLASKTSATNNQCSPSRRKLSLKIKLTTPIKSKSIYSQPSTPDRVNKIINESPKKFSPDKSKCRLSLHLPINKNSEPSLNRIRSPTKNQISSECSSNQMKSPIKNKINNNKSSDSSVHKVTVFKKLGRICKKRKHVPFLLVGNLVPKTNHEEPKIKIKSDVPINVDIDKFVQPHIDLSANSSRISNILTEDKNVKRLSSEKDSQLKFLSTESPHRVISKPSVCKINQSEVPMEIDESLSVETKILERELDFRKVESNQDRDNKFENENISEQEPRPSSSCATTTQLNIKTNTKEQKTTSQIISEVDKVPDMPDIFSSDFTDSEKCKDDNNFKNLGSNEKQCLDKTVREDVISISSIDTESDNNENSNTQKSVDSEIIAMKTNKNKNSEAESNSDSDIYVPKSRKVIEKVKSFNKFEKVEFSSSSSLSSLKTSPLKKKRSHSESSNDEDDDVTSIIDKWCDKSQGSVIKKPKVNPKVIDNAQEHLNSSENIDDFKFLDDILQDDNEKTLVNEVFEQPKVNEPQSDPPIDDIIKKVKSFKENEAKATTLIAIPSSLMSADLFESNEQNVQACVQTPSRKEITSDCPLIVTWSPNKKSDKEKLNLSPNLSDVTMKDLIQFNRKKLSSPSESSDGSNKENNTFNQISTKTTSVKLVECTEERVDEIENSPNIKCKAIKSHTANEQYESYHVSDSLMNITQEQLALKKIEKELIGVDLSAIQNSENKEVFESNTFSTPRRKREHDFDVDSIDATPIAKRRHTYNFSSKTAKLNTNAPDLLSPEKNKNLIPAITPVKNTKSYPLSHSTPMINTEENKFDMQRKKITLVCSGLSLENVKIVQSFAKKFGGTFQSTFSMDVTHIIVGTNSETKAGQKTFKYIQGIAFKKYLVSFQWVADCLKQNALLNEDDEKYEVLDPEILESGSKKSRSRTNELFEDFAIYCLEPFSSFLLDDFIDLLLHNGAVIVKTLKQLSLQKDKLKIIMLESENLSQTKVAMMKKAGPLVSYEWVVDSISQYQNLSLLPYLYETTAEEAVVLGIPPEYLVDEETVNEDEDGKE